LSRLAVVMAISLITLVVALTFQYQRQQSTAVQDEITLEQLEPDFYLTNASSSQYDTDGALEYKLYTERLEYFPGPRDSDLTRLTRPKMTLFHKDGTPWVIRAQKGQVNNNGASVDLWGDVIVNRMTANKPLMVETSTLEIIPGQGLAQTKDDVIITNNIGKLDATGMKAYIEQNKLQLLSNVTVVHEPIKLD